MEYRVDTRLPCFAQRKIAVTGEGIGAVRLSCELRSAVEGVFMGESGRFEASALLRVRRPACSHRVRWASSVGE